MNMGKLLFGQCDSFNKYALLANECKLRYLKWAIKIKLCADFNKNDLDLLKLTKKDAVWTFFEIYFHFVKRSKMQWLIEMIYIIRTQNIWETFDNSKSSKKFIFIYSWINEVQVRQTLRQTQEWGLKKLPFVASLPEWKLSLDEEDVWLFFTQWKRLWFLGREKNHVITITMTGWMVNSPALGRRKYATSGNRECNYYKNVPSPIS